MAHVWIEVIEVENENMQVNDRGERSDCRFWSDKCCTALKTWYNVSGGEHCAKCPFYKEDRDSEDEV